MLQSFAQLRLSSEIAHFKEKNWNFTWFWPSEAVPGARSVNQEVKFFSNRITNFKLEYLRAQKELEAQILLTYT